MGFTGVLATEPQLEDDVLPTEAEEESKLLDEIPSPVELRLSPEYPESASKDISFRQEVPDNPEKFGSIATVIADIAGELRRPFVAATAGERYGLAVEGPRVERTAL